MTVEHLRPILDLVGPAVVLQEVARASITPAAPSRPSGWGG